MLSEPELVANAAKGATSAALEWTEEKINSLVKRFQNGELSFIEDQETIDLVKKQTTTPLFKFYKKYVLDSDLRKQIWMGLALRDISDKNKIQDLRNNLYRKYGDNGIRVAELAQSGVISKYLNLLLDEIESEYDLIQDCEILLKDVNKYTKFIKTDDDVSRIANMLEQRINAILPRAILILSNGIIANKKADELVELLRVRIENYKIESQFDNQNSQKVHFLIKANAKMCSVTIGIV